MSELNPLGARTRGRGNNGEGKERKGSRVSSMSSRAQFVKVTLGMKPQRFDGEIGFVACLCQKKGLFQEG